MSAAVATPPKPFTMPTVTAGMTVLHFINKDEHDRYPRDPQCKPGVVLVTNVGDRSISGWSFPATETMPVYVSGLKHINDPNPSKFDEERNGFWDHTLETRAKVQPAQSFQQSQNRK